MSRGAVPRRCVAALFLVAACPTILAACVLRPVWQKLATEGQLNAYWLEGTRFRHRVLANDVTGKALRVYVDGDGGPWIRERRVSVDPTPVNPVLLRLMHGATHPAVYLGRPCYFGAASDKGCSAAYWTFERYGPAVVDSMCEAVNRIAADRGTHSVTLIGYSGGGAIVVGMRACTERLDRLITIAGNLDPDAWARYHGYTPLGDLSPVTTALEATDAVEESHWQCRDDSNVPPPITDAYFAARRAAIRHIVDTCSHSTGWENYWPQIIGEAAPD